MDFLLDKIPLNELLKMFVGQLLNVVQSFVIANPVSVVLFILGLGLAIFCQTRHKPIDKYGYSIILIIISIALKYFSILNAILFLVFIITFVLISFLFEVINIGRKYYQAFVKIATAFMVVIVVLGFVVFLAL